MEIYVWIKWKLFSPLIKFFSILFIKQEIFKNKDFTYYANKNVDPVTRFLMKFNLWEKKERNLISQIYENIDTIEAGGGIGIISLYIKKKIKDSKHIILEPNEDFHDTIKKNFETNNLNKNNLFILNLALSNENFSNITFFDFISPFTNKINLDSLEYTKKTNKNKIVNTVSIPKILEDYKINNFQLIMDVEGEEYNIIKKNNEWLKKCKCILYECHHTKNKLNSIHKTLFDFGFNLIKKKENVYLFKK